VRNGFPFQISPRLAEHPPNETGGLRPDSFSDASDPSW
jgi:hypothetical protein